MTANDRHTALSDLRQILTQRPLSILYLLWLGFSSSDGGIREREPLPHWTPHPLAKIALGLLRSQAALGLPWGQSAFLIFF